VWLTVGLCGASSALAATPVLTPVSGSPFGTGVSGSQFGTGKQPGPVAFGRSGGLLAVGDEGDGTVSVFSVNSVGWLTPVAGSPFATGTNQFGAGSMSVAFSPSGGLLAVGSVGGVTGGSVAVFSVDSSGALTQVAGSPFRITYTSYDLGTTLALHRLSVAFSPSGGLLAVTNLADAVSMFSVNSAGSLTPAAGSPFATGNSNSVAGNPDSVAFSPSGRLLATANQGGSASVFSVSSDGTLAQVPGSPFATGSGPASVAFSPSGGLLATANPGDSTMSVFSVTSGGALTPVAGSPFAAENGAGPTGPPFAGPNPGSVAFSLSGGLLATNNNSYDSTVSLFSVNSDGTLTPVAGSPFATIEDSHPSSVAFSPSGLLAVANSYDHSVSMFSISNSDAAAPSAQITSPRTGATYTLGQLVNASFGCVEGAGGPGLASCAGTAPSDTPIDTTTTGPHTFTATATSSDGQNATSTATYTVIKPSNQITVSHIKTDADGTISLQARVPAQGTLDVLETAWYDPSAQRAPARQGAAHRFASGRANAVATGAGVLHLRVGLNAEGKRLVHHGRHAVALKLWVTYIPTAGRQRTVGFNDLQLGSTGTMGAKPIVSTVKGKPRAAGCPAARHPSFILALGATLIYGGGSNPNADGTKYYACLSPHGRAVQLGTDSPPDSEYGPLGTTSGFAIAGDFAAAHVSYGEADQVECAKYNGSPCPFPTAWIDVVNVRTLSHATVSVPYTSPAPQLGLTLQDEVPLAISPDGGVAWLQPDYLAEDQAAADLGPGRGWAESENWASEGDQLWATMLVPQGPSGFSSSPTMIDSGDISASSIRFLNANTVTWSNGGIAHEQSIG
jgi:6-phosphogluconolactonase (cycloisomerase 2 family)